MKNPGAPKKMPTGLKVGKPVSQRILRSALSLEKTNPIPKQHLNIEKSKGSALVGFSAKLPKPKYTAETNFKE